jgi:hypothetical protein
MAHALSPTGNDAPDVCDWGTADRAIHPEEKHDMERDTERNRPGASQPADVHPTPLRIQRGARVTGPDGPLGSLLQLIVSQDTGELRRLVVRGEAGLDFELPADRIASATGDEIRLTIGPRDLANHPEFARPFTPERYASRAGSAGDDDAETGESGASGATLTERRLYTLRIADPDAPPTSVGAFRQLVPLAALGMLVGGAAGGLAYILARRRNASRTANFALGDASAQINTALGNTLAYANTLTLALNAAARALWASRPRVPPMRLRPRSQPATVPVAERLRRPVRAARRGAASRLRGGRQFSRRVRWLRRGLYFGIALGILFAPEPGRELRRRLAYALRSTSEPDSPLARRRPPERGVAPTRGGAPDRASGAPADADLWGAPPERAAQRFDPPAGL